MRQLEDREEDGENYIKIHTGKMYGRDSVLGIATRRRLDGSGIESQWVEIFRANQTGPEAYPGC